MLYRATREFAEKEIRPVVKELDKKTNPIPILLSKINNNKIIFTIIFNIEILTKTSLLYFKKKPGE
jgi:hypothetical protein